MTLRALVVTSRVTFVPDNYDAFVLPLARSPHVAGLLVLDNVRGVRLKAIGAMAKGARWIGGQLLRNTFWRESERRRREAYADRGKELHVERSINDDAAVAFVRAGQFDLVVNARTRDLYREAALAAPRLGCLNVHHGLLPDQRGVMCDLCALSANEPAGFSIHRMTKKIDDGEILRVVPVSHGTRSYAAHLAASAAREAVVLAELLAEIAAAGGRVAGTPNARTERTRYRRNPTSTEIRQMRAAGMEL